MGCIREIFAFRKMQNFSHTSTINNRQPGDNSTFLISLFVYTFYVTNSSFHQSGRVRWTRVRGQNAGGSFDGRARLLVRLLEILSVLVVVVAAVAVDDRRALIVDSRWGDLLHWPLQRAVLVENLFAGQSDDFLIVARVGLVILRLVARRRHLFARSVHA